jgi:hypothetical protein
MKKKYPFETIYFLTGSEKLEARKERNQCFSFLFLSINFLVID